MGWQTEIFDVVLESMRDHNTSHQAQTLVLIDLGKTLQDMDWDCEDESSYFNDPKLEEVWRNLGVNND